mgnify:CR=1 FL=1
MERKSLGVKYYSAFQIGYDRSYRDNLLVGGGIAITAILKGRKIKYQADGSVMVE